MPRPARVRRLPQRLSFSLIPAPLDLSITEHSEKSPFPSVIVTPSSPIHTQDYSIAFLAPPPSPTSPALPESAMHPVNKDNRPRLRTALLIGFVALIMLFHVVAHSLAAKRPHLDFGVQAPSAQESHFGGILDFFGPGFPDRRDFIVEEAVEIS